MRQGAALADAIGESGSDDYTAQAESLLCFLQVRLFEIDT
jgi:hypothetical protein